MADAPKILKPGQMEVQMTRQEVSPNETVQIKLQTPEGRVLIVMLQVADYHWEMDKFLIAWGQVDVTAAAQKGFITPQPKGLIS